VKNYGPPVLDVVDKVDKADKAGVVEKADLGVNAPNADSSNFSTGWSVLLGQFPYRVSNLPPRIQFSGVREIFVF
jgi:hypothetical protein